VEDLVMVPAGVEPSMRFAVSDRTVTDEGPQLARAFAVIDPDGAATEVDAVFMGGDLFRAVLPAADSGTIAYRACAEDRNGNLACSADQTYDIGGEPPGDTGDSTTGMPVDDTSGGFDTGVVDSSGGPVSMSGVTASGSGDGPGSDTDTDTAGAGGDGGGCGCRQTAGGSWGWLVLGVLAITRRRGRGSRSSST
jgi:hypothetical protein